MRSVFARGAGTRALGMGAAFVAVADDATAPLWNPAGLGRLSRVELQAGQTQYFDLDVSEAYLAVAWADWRWGAAATTLRHFGVGGIERRDDRNVLLDGDLSDAQSEIAFGYGRALGELWSVGASLKLRRQSLAGLNGTGFGLDLGVTGQPLTLLGPRAAWAQGLTWGLALVNVVQPSVRLDRESVADPSAVRTGIAWTRPLAGLRTMVAALDVEKSAESGADLHAGVEVRLHPALALRAGLTGGTMTAGTGFRWRDVALDYVFENLAVEPVHRLGMTLAFGPTIAERRDAALRAEEQAMQTRLAEAFQKRQAEQVAALLRDAEERLGQKRYDEALEMLLTVDALEPGRAEATALEIACLLGKARELEAGARYAEAAVAFGNVLALAPADTAAVAGQRRCQEMSDLHAARSADLRRQFQSAMDAFGADRLQQARRGFKQILEVDPADQEASLMLRRTEQAIARRIATLLEQAGRQTRAGQLGEAAAALEQVTALDPRADGLAAAQAALARARREGGALAAEPRRDAGAARPPAAAARPKLTGQQRRELEILYRRGLAAMKEHRNEEAIRYWELVWAADPGYQRVAEYLEHEYLMRGMESFAAGRLDEAVSFWERALQIDPKDQRAMGYLARAQKQLMRTREILGKTK